MFIILSSFGATLATKCIFSNNQPYQRRPTLVDVNSNKTHYHPFVVSIIKSGGNCNTTDIHMFEYVFQIK